jgi:hypothetical protein
LTLPADIDGDGVVGPTDVAALAEYWLAVGCAAMNDCDGADINRDGRVDLTDFSGLAALWLEGLL